MRIIIFVTVLCCSVLGFLPSVGFCHRRALLYAATQANPKEEKISKELQQLLDVLAQKEQTGSEGLLLVAQTAPSVRVAFSEAFGLPPNCYTPGHLVATLKAIGFDLVLDTNTAADLTICEEGTELLHRLQDKQETKDTMPLFTSCCPGWMNFVAKAEPDLAQYISTCKSPHLMLGAVVKQYSQEMFGKKAKDIEFVSVMPCLHKRGETVHSAFEHDGVRDIDNVITTKDLGQLAKMLGIDPGAVDPIHFDSLFQNKDGTGTGAGQLFGATGGVMTAAVRTAYAKLTGSVLPRLELVAVRGLEGVNEAVIPLHDEDGNGLPIDLRVAVCSGLGNAKELIKRLRDGEVQYDFVEVMACPFGCINGGGQPRGTEERIRERLDCIYDLDSALPLRQSHDNPTIQKLYEDYLGEFGSETAHKLLHIQPVYGESNNDDDNVAK